MDEGFVREQYRPMMIMEENPARLLDRFEAYEPPRVKKWLGPDQT